MASTLANLSPITVCGKVLPTPQLFQNIPMVHRMLEEVLVGIAQIKLIPPTM